MPTATNKKVFRWSGDILENPFLGISLKNADEVVDYLEEDENNQAYIQIYSPGGMFDVAQAIINKLEPYKERVSTEVAGLVASAGTHIALNVGSKVSAGSGSRIMIHNGSAPPSPVGGTKEQLAEQQEKLERHQERLEQIDNIIADSIVAKSGLEKKKVQDYMKEETYFTAEKALELKLIDEVLDISDKETKNFIKDVYVAYLNNNKVKEEYSDTQQNLEVEMTDEEKKEQQVENKEEVKEPEVKVIASDKKVQERLDSLESQLDFFKKERDELIARNNAMAAETRAKAEEMEVAKNEYEIKQALKTSRINEEDAPKWRELLSTGGELARETLRSLAPDLYGQELGVSYSNSIESVPEDVRNLLSAAGVPEDKIVDTYKRSRDQAYAAQYSTSMRGGN